MPFSRSGPPETAFNLAETELASDVHSTDCMYTQLFYESFLCKYHDYVEKHVRLHRHATLHALYLPMSAHQLYCLDVEPMPDFDALP